MPDPFSLALLWGKFRKPLLIGLAVLVAVMIVWRLLVAFGDARYKQGRADNELAWRVAESKLHEQEAAARTSADRAASARNSAHAELVAKEKEQLNDALREGYSPIDVLFGHADDSKLLGDKDRGRK